VCFFLAFLPLVRVFGRGVLDSLVYGGGVCSHYQSDFLLPQSTNNLLLSHYSVDLLREFFSSGVTKIPEYVVSGHFEGIIYFDMPEWPQNLIKYLNDVTKN